MICYLDRSLAHPAANRPSRPCASRVRRPRPRCLVIAFAITALSFPGCGPSKLLSPPAELPPTLAGRSLWNTPTAYVYATDKSIAGETERWVEELAAHLERTYDRPLGKGLVFVVDKNEQPVIQSLDALARLAERSNGSGSRSGPPAVEGGERRDKYLDAGMTETLACSIIPVLLDDVALAEAGLAGPLPDDIAWRLACPSHRLMESAMWEFAPKAIEKEKGKAFAIATAWALPLAIPQVAKAFRLARDVTVFQDWCRRQDDWSADYRAEQIPAYTKQRAFRISPTLSMAMSMAGKQQREKKGEESEQTPEDAGVTPP